MPKTKKYNIINISIYFNYKFMIKTKKKNKKQNVK